MHKISLQGVPALHTAVGAPPLASGPYMSFVGSAQDQLKKGIGLSERGDRSRVTAERFASEANDTDDKDKKITKLAAAVREYGQAIDAYSEMGADYYNAILSYENAVGALRRSRLIIGGVLGGSIVLAFVGGGLVGHFTTKRETY